MAKIKLSDYLFKRIQELGVDKTFGIPGDFVLPLYAAQQRIGMETVVLTHEPSIGFAADAYGRLRGLGVALTTYGAGGLNMINPVGLAYAEESPLLVISGAPETKFRSNKPQFHHCVKDFQTQLRVFEAVTESQAVLDNPILAQAEIDRVLETTVKKSRPGYIEIPRDMVNAEIEIQDRVPDTIENQAPTEATYAAVSDILSKLSHSKQPVLMAGAQLRRFHLMDKVISFCEALNIPVVTSILGKASFPETHRNFIGNYFGQFGNPKVKEFVEASDCILCLGAVLTEMETAGYTAKLPVENLIQVTYQEVSVGHHSYNGLDIKFVVEELVQQAIKSKSVKFQIPNIEPEELPDQKPEDALKVSHIIKSLNSVLTPDFGVVSDVGDCLYSGLSLKTDIFIAPGYYSSMGFGTPAGIGAQIANPKRRSIILVGDGAFQMTGMEISTAIKHGINPIVVLFNNSSYAMLKFIDQQRDYYDLARWDYVKLTEAIGGKAVRAKTGAEFTDALSQALKSDKLFLIDAILDKEDISPTLKRLTDHFGKKVRAALAQAN
ncbi:MAG: thiamine pyrophosphate-binding protein [Candidatus Melainabacteria bacterium]|nr:thiamine pyrophosphate-binding protein [Candidatus Melainabacteria bacterium]